MFCFYCYATLMFHFHLSHSDIFSAMSAAVSGEMVSTLSLQTDKDMEKKEADDTFKGDLQRLNGLVLVQWC